MGNTRALLPAPSYGPEATVLELEAKRKRKRYVNEISIKSLKSMVIAVLDMIREGNTRKKMGSDPLTSSSVAHIQIFYEGGIIKL